MPEPRSFAGTLHMGNLCNNNYKLMMALRGRGVDARIILVERITSRHPVSDPADYDPDYDPTAPHVTLVPFKAQGLRQLAAEAWAIRREIRARSPRHWVHAQSEYPVFAHTFTRHYSCQSTGSDLRDDYQKGGPAAHLLRRAYRRAPFKFHGNIDLWNHEVSRLGNYSFLPNVVDFAKFQPTEQKPNRRLRILMPSRNTYDQPRDIKGHRMLVEALQSMPPDFEADLVVSAEDQGVVAFTEALADLAPRIGIETAPFRNEKRLYLAQIDRADLVIDQFKQGLMGGTALDCFAMRKVALVHLDRASFSHCYGHECPIPALNEVQAIRDFLARMAHTESRLQLADHLYEWVRQEHEAGAVADFFLSRLAGIGVTVDIGVTEDMDTSGRRQDVA